MASLDHRDSHAFFRNLQRKGWKEILTNSEGIWYFLREFNPVNI